MKYSDTGTRTQVAWVKARYPNQLDYIGLRTQRMDVWTLEPVINGSTLCASSGGFLDHEWRLSNLGRLGEYI